MAMDLTLGFHTGDDTGHPASAALAGDALAALARRVMSRLATDSHRQPPLRAPVISGRSLAAFCDTLTTPSPTAALRFMAARRAEGMARQDLYLGYIVAAARKLGEGWDDGALGLVDVTLGINTLHAVMRALRSEGGPDTGRPDSRRCALFATVPNELHCIGVIVAAHVFRENGWDIDLQIGATHAGLVGQVARCRPAIIGLSLSTDARVPDLVRLVADLRRAAPEAVIGVAPGACLDAEGIGRQADADLVFRDVQSASAELDRLIRLRDRRLAV